MPLIGVKLEGGGGAVKKSAPGMRRAAATVQLQEIRQGRDQMSRTWQQPASRKETKLE